jgi:outer membrane protein OmpA-like peptidoglycan-associated protein
MNPIDTYSGSQEPKGGKVKVRTLLLALLIVALPALVSAYPAFYGGKGLLRIQNALVEDEAGLTISAHGLGLNPAFLTDGRYKKGWVMDLLAPELSYAPVVNKYVGVEVFGAWGGVFQTPKNAAGGGFTMATGDLRAGGKVSVPILPVLKLGFTGSYTFTSGRNDLTGGVTWLDRDALPVPGDPSSPSPSKFTWAALATVQLQDELPTAPNIMFNYGKVNDESRTGMGIEFAGQGFSLFGEAMSRQPTGSTGLFDTDTGHVYLTPGVVFGNVSSFSFLAAYSFVLGHHADNEAILGISIATGFGAHPKPQFGSITGRVTDEKTSAALTANVDFPKDDQMKSFTTDASGVFEVKKVKVGVTVVEVGAAGYESQTVPLDVKKGAVTTYDFKLRSVAVGGVVAGTVLDAVTKKPLNARIEFPQSSIAAVNSDQPGGAFRVNSIPAAVYTVTAALQGYFTGSQTVTVEEGKVANVAFNLTPSSLPPPPAQTGQLSGVVTDMTTKAPLGATVSFPGTSIPSVQSDPTTGLYKATLPLGPVVVACALAGYVTQMSPSPVIIQSNVPAVYNFQMLKIGTEITLSNDAIHFDFNSSQIQSAGYPALDEWVKLMKDNPYMTAEIQGHTDAVGSFDYNQNLSEQRAQSVVSYLTSQGIERSRLTSIGYGKTRLLVQTQERSETNRRVIFRVVGEKK